MIVTHLSFMGYIKSPPLFVAIASSDVFKFAESHSEWFVESDYGEARRLRQQEPAVNSIRFGGQSAPTALR